MIAALIIAGFTLLAGLLLWLTHREAPAPPEAPAEPEPGGNEPQEESGGVCCGLHAVCRKMPPSAPEYFDDEELDVYAGRDAASYDDAETEQFREVLLTLAPGEAPLWERSLRQRGIALPEPLRDELMILISDTAPSAPNDPSAAH